MAATVKIVGLGDDGQGSTGSGTIVDPRGYILTSFHVVGFVDPKKGVPGQLINSTNRYRVAVVDPINLNARPRWVATVVRANVRLDLALLRILGDVEGRPARALDLTYLEINPSSRVRPGTRVWAFGFPQGSRTLRTASDTIEEVEENTVKQGAWLRFAQGLDVGMSGATLVNEQGQFVGVPSVYEGGSRKESRIKRARPTYRVPRSWLSAMAREGIGDARVAGVELLSLEQPHYDLATGDAGGRGVEEHFFALPLQRPLTLSTNPVLKLNLYQGSRLVRSGQGKLELKPETQNAIVGVEVSVKGKRPTPYTLELTKTENAAAPPVASSRRRSSSSSYQQEIDTDALLSNPFFTVPRASKPGAKAPASARREEPKAGTTASAATLRGRMLDALTGRPIRGATFVVGKPGVDLQRLLSAFLAGEMSQRKFNEALVGTALTDVYGRFELEGVPRSKGYPAAAIAPGYSPTMLKVSISWLDASVELPKIELTR